MTSIRFRILWITSLFLGFCIFDAQLGNANPASDSFVQYGFGSLEISDKDLAKGVVDRELIGVNLRKFRSGMSIGTRAPTRLGRTGKNQIEMMLADESVVLQQTRAYSIVSGLETITGTVLNSDSGWFVFSIDGMKLQGQVHYRGMIYDIRFDDTLGQHVLSMIDYSKMPKSNSEPLDGKIKSHSKDILWFEKPLPMSLGDTNATVRVLVLYGSDVSGISSIAANSIAMFNDSYQNSGLSADFIVDLAGTRQLNSDLEGVCKNTAISLMENANFPFIGINNWQSNNHADLVLTVLTTDTEIEGCSSGYGRVGGQGSGLLDSDNPYAVTMDDYAVGDLTAIHELGHLMGGGHPDWSYALLMDQSDDQAEPYARGYISSTQDFQTIMGAYASGTCDFDYLPPDCERIPRWSDPGATYLGEAIGITYVSTTQSPPAADMKSALESKVPSVAAWESYPHPAPDAPDIFSVSSQYCYGLNNVDWDAATYAENYQVLRAYDSGFTDPDVIYFGSITGMVVDVPQNETWYLKVRSCNGSGCGDLTSQHSTTYYNGCL